MMTPPMLLKIALAYDGHKRLNLWIPLLILYILLLPFILIFLVISILACFVLWICGFGVNPFKFLFWLYDLWCSSKGLRIDVKSKNEKVFILVI